MKTLMQTTATFGRSGLILASFIAIFCVSAVALSQKQNQSDVKQQVTSSKTIHSRSKSTGNFLTRMWGWKRSQASKTADQNAQLQLVSQTTDRASDSTLEPIPDNFPHTGIMSVNSQDDKSMELQNESEIERAIPLNPYQLEQQLLPEYQSTELQLPPAPAVDDTKQSAQGTPTLTIAEPLQAPLQNTNINDTSATQLPASSPVIPPVPEPVVKQNRPEIVLKRAEPKAIKVPVTKAAPIKDKPIPEVPVMEQPKTVPMYAPEATFGHRPSFQEYSPFAAYGPSRVRCGVHCATGHCYEEKHWDDAQTIPWEIFAQGEYVGPARLRHVPEYRLRVDDVVDFVYRLKGDKSALPYRLNVGDMIRIESLTDETLEREVLVQPDGNITVRLLGQVPASNRTLEELTKALNDQYKQLVKQPAISVTPINLNSKLEELRSTVDRRAGSGGQSQRARVTPEGTIQLPAIGSVPAQGLTLTEMKLEIERRYDELVSGLEVTPILAERAPRFVYVTGEVGAPGRFPLEAPTTVIQAIALAGSWNIGADLRNIVILRRDENWQLMATRVNLHKALFGKQPCPEGELWLRDSDIVILPKSKIQWTGDLVELIFTRIIYGVAPFSYSVNFTELTAF